VIASDGAHAHGAPALFGGDEAISFPHTVQDRGDIEGAQGAQIDHFGVNAFASEDFGYAIALGLPTPALHLLGGASTSAVWAQLRADVLRRAHHVSEQPDACPLGAAMIALVAAGGARDLAAAAELVAPPARTFTPGAAVDQDALDAAYRRYQAITALLIPTWASTTTAAPAR
jgi:hypothetical protein